MMKLSGENYHPPKGFVRDLVPSPPYGSSHAESIGRNTPKRIVDHLAQLTPEMELRTIARIEAALDRRVTEHTIVADGLERLLQPRSVDSQIESKSEAGGMP